MITIGIDLGTTNSCVAFHDGQGPMIIETASGAPVLPSVVALQEDGRFTVGKLAVRALVRDPRYTFKDIKRHIGLPFRPGEDYGFQITEKDGMRAYRGRSDNEVFLPEFLSAEILKTLKAQAERRIGRVADGAVITVPAGFTNDRVDRVRAAGMMAGFKAVHILTEPEAAVMAYGLHRTKGERVLVFDLGGGTFDVVLATAGGGYIKVLAKDGNDGLGGVDWDRRIRNFFADAFEAEWGEDIRGRDTSMLKLMPVAQEAKEDLTEADSTVAVGTNVALDHKANIMRDGQYTLTRAAFEEMTADLLDDAMRVIDRVLAHAGKVPEQVDEVLLIGGMTRVPAIRAALEAAFGPGKLRDSVPADLAVAIGASIKAAEIDKRLSSDLVLDEITAHAFGLEILGGEMMPVFPKGTRLGQTRTVVVTTTEADQEIIPLDILQGDDPVPENNTVLARYDHPVPPGPGGAPSLELTFSLDREGVLSVTGRDPATETLIDILGRPA